MDHDQALQINALEGYVLDDLSAAERDAFEWHLFSCRLCAEDLMWLGDLIDTLKDPVIAERFHTPHPIAAYVLEDLSPERSQEFELHMKTCNSCARNVKLGKCLLKRFLESNTQLGDGTRLLHCLRFVRWFRLVFGD